MLLTAPGAGAYPPAAPPGGGGTPAAAYAAVRFFVHTIQERWEHKMSERCWQTGSSKIVRVWISAHLHNQQEHRSLQVERRILQS